MSLKPVSPVPSNDVGGWIGFALAVWAVLVVVKIASSKLPIPAMLKV